MADKTFTFTILGKEKVSPATNKAGKEIDKFSDKLKGLGAGAAAAGGAAGLALGQGILSNLNVEQANAKLAAQLGLSKDTAGSVGKIAGDLYRDNFGNSIEDVNGAIHSIGVNLGDVSKMSEADIKKMSQAALGLSQVFGVDVADSTRAASKLISTGLVKNSAEAFDLITAGFQNGLDSSGDFLDTLNEYASQFSKIGIDGPTAINGISQFLKAGARDTDAAADAFKEFGLNAISTAKSTTDAYKGLDLNADKFRQTIAKGGPQATQAMQQVVDALKKVKDPVEQNRIGTELFGTQWEDTVRAILPQIDLTKGGIDNISGATDRMNATVGETGAAKIEGMKRAFEGWTQSMASSDGAVGDVSAAVAGLGGPAISLGANLGIMAAAATQFSIGSKLAATGTKLWAAAQWVLDAALSANPIGLVVIAVAALVAGIILAWKHSQKFREIVTQVWTSVAKVVISSAGMLVNAAAKAFGWVPGLGPKLKEAASNFEKFRKKTNAQLDKVNTNMKLKGDITDLEKKIKAAKAALKTVPKEQVPKLKADISQMERKLNDAKAKLSGFPNHTAKLTADITNLTARIADAKARLRSVPPEKRASIKGEIRDLESKVARAKSAIRGIRDRTVSVWIKFFQRGSIKLPGFGHIKLPNLGNLFRAAGGPVRGMQPYVVGERGPELFVPGRSGKIIPHDGLRSGPLAASASTTVNVYVTQPLASADQVATAVARAFSQVGLRGGGPRIPASALAASR